VTTAGAPSPLITLASVPRSFEHPVARAQRNAVNSWRALGDEVEIILCGQDDGVAEFARAVGAVHLPDIQLSELGTPLLDSVLRAATTRARARLVCYVNTDIVLLPDFLESVRRVRQRRFLMVGQRWDLDMPDELTFDSSGIAALQRRVASEATLHPPAGSDYFVFPADLPWKSPPLVVGRGLWDNWLIYRARALHVPVIDASSSITAIHQNHDYGHVLERRDAHWSNPEADINRQLVGEDQVFQLFDATRVLTPNGVRPLVDRAHLQQRYSRTAVLYPRVWRIIGPLRRLRKALTGRASSAGQR
jgi:hypothetical protein